MRNTSDKRDRFEELRRISAKAADLRKALDPRYAATVFQASPTLLGRAR
jgi:hypothetical protein